MVGIDCGAGAERCGDGKGLLAWYQRLLQIFGRGPYQFGIFWSVLVSVYDIDAPNWNPGVGMPCGRMGIRRDPLDGVDDVF